MNKTKDNNKFNYWAYLKNYKFRLFWIIMIYITTSGLDIFLTIKFAHVIELITTSQYMSAIKWVVILGVTLISQMLLYLINGLTRNRLMCDVSNSISIAVADQAFKISSGSYSDHNTSSFMQRIATDPTTIFQKIMQMIDYITSLISSIVMFVYITTLNLYIGLILALSVLMTTLVERVRIKLRKKHWRETLKSHENVHSFINEIVRSERDVKSLNLEASLKTKTTNLYDDYKSKHMHMQKFDWSLWSVRNSLIHLTTAVTLAVAIWQVDLGLMTLASFMIVYSNRNSLYSLSRIFADIFNCASEISVAVGRINELYENDEYKLEKFGNRKLKNVKGRIEFKDVSFSYIEYKERDKKLIEQEKKYNRKHKIKTRVPTREQIGTNKVFEKLNFTIEPNTTVAFVGVSGSGKSTILNLISKINEVDKGRVLIDNVNIKSLDKETIRSSISLVNQFPYIFDMTIKENLLMAKPDATDEEISMAIKDSALNEFVSTLKDGINTRVGESGIKLSGGQKQRLAIARALLKKSSIILFDESTSSLDNLAQNQIKQSIDNIKGKSTIVIVAHRLSTIKNVDKIFFLEHGEIVDSGTFRELMKSNKNFKKIFTAEDV